MLAIPWWWMLATAAPGVIVLAIRFQKARTIRSRKSRNQCPSCGYSRQGIPNDVAAGKVVSGYPAIENRQWLRSVAIFNKLPELSRRLRHKAKNIA